jgi:hypothetical protein
MFEEVPSYNRKRKLLDILHAPPKTLYTLAIMIWKGSYGKMSNVSYTTLTTFFYDQPLDLFFYMWALNIQWLIF